MLRFWGFCALLCLSIAPLAAQTSYANGSLTVEGTINFCSTDTGSGNSFVCQDTAGATISTYHTGSFYSFRASHANTGAATLNIDGVGAKTLKKLGGTTDLASGDIATGSVVQVQYDGTYFEMESPIATLPAVGATAVTNDTNVTGSIASSNLTLGWNGTLAKNRQYANTMYSDSAATLGSYKYDFSSAQFVSPNGASLPGSCSVGQLFFNTAATAGQNIYECATTNTWTQQVVGTGGGGGAATPNTTFPICGNGAANSTKACTSGTDYQPPLTGTITEANAANINADIASLTNGGTVIIPPGVAGTVNASIAVNNPNITLFCLPGSAITASSGAAFDMFDVYASGFTMNGCHVNYNGGTHVLMVLTNSGATISGITIANNTLTGGGITLNNTLTNVAITGNTITSPSAGIFGSGAVSDVRVSNNWVTNTSATSSTSAIVFHSSGTGLSENNLAVSNNHIFNQGTFCLEIGAFGGNSPTDVTVSGNQCNMTANSGGGYSFDTVTNLTMTGNTFNGQGFTSSIDGIELVNGSNATVSGNTVTGATVTVNREFNAVLDHNLISNSGVALYIGGSVTNQNSSYAQIRNNTFTCPSCTSGTRMVWIQSNASGSTVNDVQISGNLFTGSSAGEYGILIEDDGGSTSGTNIDSNTFNAVSTCIYPGTNSGTTYIKNNNLDGCTTTKVANPLSGVTLVGDGTGSETVTYSSTPSFSTAFRSSILTLTGNVSSFTLQAGADGQSKTLTFCQDSTGSRTVAAPANVHGFMTVGTTASKCSTQAFVYSVGQTAWLASAAGVINQ